MDHTIRFTCPFPKTNISPVYKMATLDDATRVDHIQVLQGGIALLYQLLSIWSLSLWKLMDGVFT